MSNDLPEEARDNPASSADEASLGNSDLRPFVTFLSGGEVFAVDMAPVQEIIRVPEVVRVPLAPPSLEGLANLRGKVLPIVSLRHIFGFESQAVDDASRAVVIDFGQPLGFVVDRVASVLGVEPGQIEGVDTIRATVNTDLLSGIIKDAGGHAMVMILDFEKLIRQEYATMIDLKRAGGTREALANGDLAGTEAEAEDNGDAFQLVSFDVAGQEFAIAIEDVQEIVQIPEQIIRVPHAASHVLGVMTLRNRLLPLVSLRSMFALPARSADEHSRVVVVSLGSVSVGVVMDRVNAVLRLSRSVVDPMPALLAREGELADISEICRLDEGRRLVSIINARNLFKHSAVKEALKTVDNLDEDKTRQGDEEELASDDDEQMVVFRLGKEEFGAPIASVQEIVRVPDELTKVPKSPAFVEGVINLRGTVLPVIDLRRRLGLADVARTDRQRIMVYLIGGVRTGFIVDSVAEVLRIPRAAVEPAPRLSGDQSRLLARMANLERQHRLVQLIDPAHLLEGDEMATLAASAAGGS